MSQINQPFTLTCEHYDQKVSITIDHSDLTYSEVFEMMINLSRAIGFADSTINDAIFSKSLEIQDYDTNAEAI